MPETASADIEMVKRKRLLYKTKVDYQIGKDGHPVNDYALNHALGCSHGCEFPCYARGTAIRSGNVGSAGEWSCPKPVENALEMLEREIKAKDDVRRVHMCFTTDPFPYTTEQTPSDVAAANKAISETTLDMVRLLNGNSIPVTLLTKGILPNPAEFENADPDNYYGITLVSLDAEFQEEWEPGASPYDLRIKSLRKLHESGARTWVSMEPFPAFDVIDPSATPMLDDPASGVAEMADLWRSQSCGKYHLEPVFQCLCQVPFVDRIVFGRWNYNDDMPTRCVDDVDAWYDAAAKAVRWFGERRGIEVIVKRGTENGR